MYKIGLVMKSLNADFFKTMRDGAVAYAASRDDLELVCVGTDSQTEVERQIELVDDLVRQRVDAIVLVPIDSKALVRPAVDAVKAGVDVVNIDIKLDDDLLDEAGVKIPFAGPDNFEAAYKVSQRLASMLREGDEVAVIEGLPSADNAKQRREGALKAIAEKHLKVVASVPADWETDDARKAFAGIWDANPALKAVFCGNDAMALGVLREMEARGNYLPVAGFDNDAVMKPYLDDGRLVGTVDIFSSKMAVEGIEYAIRILDKQLAMEGTYPTPYKLV